MLGGRPEEVGEIWDEASPSAHLPLGFRYVLACGTQDIHWEPNEVFAARAREAGDDVELLPLAGRGPLRARRPAGSGMGADPSTSSTSFSYDTVMT